MSSTRCRTARSAAEATDPDSALNRLQEDVLTYVGHALDDDAAMLLLRRQAA